MNALNQDQDYASDEFFKFMLTPSEKEFSISGPAGTGKTFLLQYLIDKILPQYREACKLTGAKVIINAVSLTATTNRAADVLTGHFGQPAQTIHSFMNLRVRDDFKTGKQKIEKTRNFMIHRDTLIIIDEASMIDRELDRIIQEATHSSCKIVYVGDDKQLAPVGEKVSVVFTRPMRRVTLNQPMRNSGQPALMALCQQMRTTVETGIFKPISLVPGVIDLLSDQEMQDHVNTNFKTEGFDSRILAYTNNQVKDYNNYIRSIRGYDERLHDGELVVNNQGADIPGQGMMSAEKEFIVKRVDAPDVLYEIDGMQVYGYPVELHSVKGGVVFNVMQPVNREYFNDVVKYLGKNSDWPNYFKLKNNFPDLRSRDSSTVYKAQGSTFQSVYIDLQNIGTSNIFDQVARMLYVAVSRPRERIYLYGRLPNKYLGG